MFEEGTPQVSETTPETPQAEPEAPEPQEGSEETAETSESAQVESSEAPEGEGKAKDPNVLEDIKGKLVRLKIDGQNVNVPLTELVSRVQKAAAADKRFQEAAQVRKQAENVVRHLKNDFETVLLHPQVGYTEEQLDKWAEDRILGKYEYEKMTPEQRELHDLKRKISKEEAEKKREAETAQQREIAELTAKYREDYQKQIMDAIDQGGLPKSAGTVKRIAFYLLEGLKRNIRLKPEQVIKEVRGDLEREYREMFHAAPAERLVEIFGQDVADKIRKHSVEALKKQPEGQVVEPEGGMEPRQKKKLTKDEWKALIAKRAES